METKPHVVVLGGGISGISTAMYLLEKGYPVTLVEARKFLGGRAFSITDTDSGGGVDNGQHVIVGCCTYFRDFLRRLGVQEKWYLQPRLRIQVLDRRGKEGLLASSCLPSPFHLLPAFLAYPHLAPSEKLRVMLALARAKFTDRHQEHLERLSFYQWLKEQGQSERAIQNLWNLLVMPTLNDDVRDVSASMGLMIVQEGMLEGYHNADLGYARDSLLDSIGSPAREYLDAKGCKLLLGRPIKRVILGKGMVKSIELTSGESLSAPVYVSALPCDVLLRVLSEELVEAQPFFHQLKGLETSPIINIHLWYDRPVMEGDFCAFVDSPVQWVFNKSAIHPNKFYPNSPDRDAESSGEGQYICISVSAAWEFIDLPREELAEKFVTEMARVFPRGQQARVVRSLVVKQRNATFRCLPGANNLRPGSRTPIANLFLAGEWTHTGWPSTMESAVRSGYNAAAAISSSTRTASSYL
jgi:squalene-associated FAD-dependent desaturase